MIPIWTRFPEPMRRAIANSTEEAALCGCEEVAVEHLVCAICKDSETAACFVFEHAGLSPSSLLEQIRAIAPKGSHRRQRAARLSAAAMHLLDVAAGEADRCRHSHVGTEHVALALPLVNHNQASELLRSLKFSHEKAEAAMKKWHTDGVQRRRAQMLKVSGKSRWAMLGKMLSIPSVIWKGYFGKSLVHPGFVANPYPLYRWLRENAPVRRDPVAPVWVLSRHADVATMLKDPRFDKDPFASQRFPAIVREQLGILDEPAQTTDIETVSMLFLDPPQHTRVRAIFSKAFTPKMIAGLLPRIQLITDKRLEKVLPSGKMDVIEAIAYPLPVVVIAELLGFPPEDYPLYKKWSDDFAAALGLNPSRKLQDAAAQSRVELQAYFDKLVTKLEKEPGDNLLSALLAMEHEQGALSREELFINAALLLAAGHETTTNLIANGIYHLLKHPEQLQLLRENPSLIESAVEELLRFDSPVQWVSRVVGQRLEMGGKTLESGAILLGSIGAANRDPAVFPDPERLDLRRSDNRHLSFGSGIHFCLGAALARMEAQIAIGTIVQKCQNLRLAQRRIRWKKGMVFRAIYELRVRFDPV
jgi:cytochrome P450